MIGKLKKKESKKKSLWNKMAFQTAELKPKSTINSIKRQKNYIIRKFNEIGLGANIEEYLLNSTLHGLKYIGIGNLSFVER